MAIVIATASHEDLSAIQAMWRRNSATLGFFPDGAFEAHLKNKWILVARADGRVVGYTIYRLSKGRATLVHLCVSPHVRRNGIARSLVEEIKQRTVNYDGILVQCRREYDASKLWPELGFVAKDERQGRGKDGAALTLWWHDHHNQTDLFTERDRQILSSRPPAVLDANVLFDHQDSHAESDGLQAGWVQDEIALCVTPEIYNEIHRQQDDHDRRRRRNFARSLTQLEPINSRVEVALVALEAILPKPLTESAASDFCQLTHAVAGSAKFFITRDRRLLDHGPAIRRATGVYVVRPSILVTQLDRLLRDAAYQPDRLAGCGLHVRKVEAEDEVALWKAFTSSSRGEKKHDFLEPVRAARSYPRNHDLLLIDDRRGKLQGMICFDRSERGQVTIPLLRVRRGTLAEALSRHLIADAVMRAAEEGRTVVRISDPHLARPTIQGLQEHRFYRVSHSWYRLVIRSVKTAAQTKSTLTRLRRSVDSATTHVAGMIHARFDAARDGDTDLVEIERDIWPAKIKDAEAQCYIVPIQPRWAMHLFDRQLADEQLFPAIDHLALNRENVYYRSHRPSMSAPARILWYVSGTGRYQNRMQLRACSYLDEVVVAKPKIMFRQFERLGVYEWKDILAMTKHDLNREIMALRFSDTERLSHPLTFSDVQATLERFTGHGNPLAGPVSIPPDCFIALYCQATNHKG